MKVAANPMGETEPNSDWLANPDVRRVLEVEYDKRMNNASAVLYNQFISYIAEAKLPLNLVLLVVSLLHQTLMEECQKRYLKKE